jgi:hypothetical protein
MRDETIKAILYFKGPLWDLGSLSERQTGASVQNTPSPINPSLCCYWVGGQMFETGDKQLVIRGSQPYSVTLVSLP